MFKCLAELQCMKLGQRGCLLFVFFSRRSVLNSDRKVVFLSSSTPVCNPVLNSKKEILFLTLPVPNYSAWWLIQRANF